MISFGSLMTPSSLFCLLFSGVFFPFMENFSHGFPFDRPYSIFLLFDGAYENFLSNLYMSFDGTFLRPFRFLFFCPMMGISFSVFIWVDLFLAFWWLSFFALVWNFSSLLVIWYVLSLSWPFSSLLNFSLCWIFLSLCVGFAEIKVQKICQKLKIVNHKIPSLVFKMDIAFPSMFVLRGSVRI